MGALPGHDSENHKFDGSVSFKERMSQHIYPFLWNMHMQLICIDRTGIYQ